MAASYATRADLYGVGLQRGSLVNPRRAVSAVDAATNRLTVDDHGLRSDHPVQFVAAPNATLPAPLVESAVYYAKPITASIFEVAATVGGATIDLTTADTDSFSLVASMDQDIDDELESHSRWLDAQLASHGAPFKAPYPRWVVTAVAKRAAASLIRTKGLAGRQAILDEAEQLTLDIIAMGKKGIPLRDASATAQTMLSVPSTVTARSARRTIP